MDKFGVLYASFPEELRGKIRGGVIRHKGHILVCIDNTQTKSDQEYTLRHELAHIALNHLDTPFPGDGVVFDSGFYRSNSQEAEADKYAEHMTDANLSELLQNAVWIKHIGEEESMSVFAQI